MESKGLRVALRIWVGLVLAFLFVPIVLIVLYSFNSSNIESWPISHFSLHWFAVAWHDQQVRSAFLLSVRVGLVAWCWRRGWPGQARSAGRAPRRRRSPPPARAVRPSFWSDHFAPGRAGVASMATHE